MELHKNIGELYNEEVFMKKVSVRRVMNKTIMNGSPIHEIAVMFDKKMPDYIAKVVDLVDSSSKNELMRWMILNGISS